MIVCRDVNGQEVIETSLRIIVGIGEMAVVVLVIVWNTFIVIVLVEVFLISPSGFGKKIGGGAGVLKQVALTLVVF
jgi:hypothetical protein